jgi:hypothetical protein
MLSFFEPLEDIEESPEPALKKVKVTPINRNEKSHFQIPKLPCSTTVSSHNNTPAISPHQEKLSIQKTSATSGKTTSTTTIIATAANQDKTSISDLSRENLLDIVVPVLDAFTMREKNGWAEKTLFHGTCIPQIEMRDYVERLLQYGKISHSTLIIALIYLDRLLVKETLEMTDWTIHRILLAASVLAAKYHADDYYNNYHMAAVGGVKLRELNDMEMSLISSLNFSLWVSPDIFSKYESLLILSSEQEDK